MKKRIIIISIVFLLALTFVMTTQAPELATGLSTMQKINIVVSDDAFALIGPIAILSLIIGIGLIGIHELLIKK
jgi:hypothetical protein